MAEATTTNSRETGRKEATMAFSSTFSITCPNCGDVLAATDAGFSATTVTTAGCFCGEVGTVVRKGTAYGMATPVAVGLRHQDGLVTFTG